jgi:long-subunit acyl-CoA synthetase (AMP-forming)
VFSLIFKRVILFNNNFSVFILLGSALTSDEVFSWMQKTFKRLAVFDGYGTTEAGGIAVNHRVAPECVVHLTSCSDLGYSVDDQPLPRGLLWVHTPQVAIGYYKRKEQTDESFQEILNDGRMFFNTGDIVEYDAEKRRISVIDRAKNLFKLAQGVYVSPEALEGCLLFVCFVVLSFLL